MANLLPSATDGLWDLTRKLLQGFASGQFSSGGGGGGGGGGAVTLAAASVAPGAYSAGALGVGSIAASAIALGAFAADSISAGALGFGALATGAFSTGSVAAGAAADGWSVTHGLKTDLGAINTDATPVSIVGLLKGLISLFVGGSATVIATQNVAGSLNVTAVQGSAPNLKAQVSTAASGIAASSAVDGWDLTQGAKADAAVTNPASSGSVIALLKGVLTADNANANVGGKTFTIKLNPTISTSAYSAGFVVGGKQVLTSAVTKNGGTGILESLVLLDKSAQAAPMDIFIFDVDPTAATTTDHGAFAWSTNDVNVIARVSVQASDYVTVKSQSVAVKSGLGIAVQSSATANLWAVAITSGTPTYATAADLQWVWGILQD